MLQDFVQAGIGQRMQLGIAPILDRVRHKHVSWIRTQCPGLSLGCLNELGSSYSHRGNTPTFKVCNVMRTARRAGTSIAQGFDDQVNFGGNLL